MSFQGMSQQQTAAMVAEKPSDSGAGSFGPVIGVLAMVAVLAVAAGVTGRLCAGGRIFGFGRFDVERWMEKKFGRCIDGTVDEPPPPTSPPPRRQTAVPAGVSGPVPVAVPVEVIVVPQIPEPSPPYSPGRHAGGFPASLQL